jgi:tetratricopeptide (TPR) repeat protein
VLGPDHPDTATSLNNLGSLLQDLGDLAGARSCYEHALQIWQARENRYQEAVSFFQLGRLAVQLGRVGEGARLVAVCFLIDQVIGHRDTEQDWLHVTTITTQLTYSQEQLETMLQEPRRTERIAAAA